MTAANCIIGIDPGLSGAIAVYDPSAKKIHTVIDMPVITEIRSRHKERNIDINRVACFMSEMVVEFGVEHVIIEKVQSSPQMGVASAFKFGDGFGVVRAIAEMYAPNVHYVSPQKWKARMMLSADKKKSVELAQKLFGVSPHFTKSSKDGQAEAALLAYYGARDLVVVKNTSEEEEDPLS